MKKQLKGLAIIGGEGPEPAFCGLLAKDADIIIAADSGLEAAENSRVNPDWIVGDMDSLSSLKMLEKYPKEIVLRFPQDKDLTDTELALELLWEKGCKEICISGGGGGRLDHLFALRSLFERERYPQRWVTASNDIRCLDSADLHLESEKPVGVKPAELVLDMYRPDTLVSVFPLGDGPWNIQSQGLKWPLDNVVWSRGTYGISNRTIGDCFTIKAIKGRFMIVLPVKY